MLDCELDARVFENALRLLNVLSRYLHNDKKKIIEGLKSNSEGFEHLVYAKALILLRDINNITDKILNEEQDVLANMIEKYIK